MRKTISGLTGALLLASLLAVPASAGNSTETQTRQAIAEDYVVVLDEDTSAAEGRAAVESAGGTVVAANTAVGTLLASASNTDFIVEVSDDPAVYGAARNQPIGQVPRDVPKDEIDDVERLSGERASNTEAPDESTQPEESSDEPLRHLQWNLDVINAEKAHLVTTSSHKVKVGVMDTGIDASHPDIAPNFNRKLSRNFTVDIPSVDGPCEEEQDASCEDPADVDEHSHGTLVAGIIGSPLNGLGIAGVAPDVSLVNLRVGQDSGYFFIQPFVDALTYAGHKGIDVVNMSFFIDPWLFNCAANPADSPAEQLEQRAIIRAAQRALDYAHRRGVTLVGALGNEATDLGDPRVDPISPDFPPGNERVREIDNSCLSLPSEGRHVLGVSGIGPSLRKAYYSNYGLEQADLSAPGGDFYDFPGTDLTERPENLILAPYVEAVAREFEEIDEDGMPTTPFVVRDCSGGECAYYTYVQGTSMAAPHVVGVAALVIDRYGKADRKHGGLKMDPQRVGRVLKRTANDQRCPKGRLQSYPEVVPEEPTLFDAYCEGSAARNGFYGHGIVDAFRAVTTSSRR